MNIIEDNQNMVNRIIAAIGEENVLESNVPRERRAMVRVKTDKLRDTVTYIKENEGLTHLATISGVDLGEEREIVYHFNKKDIILNLKVRVPADKPIVPSITQIINGAVLYEREVNDLLGVFPEGHPNPKRLNLSEDWPQGVHPLLKKWDIKGLRKVVDGAEWT